MHFISKYLFTLSILWSLPLFGDITLVSDEPPIHEAFLSRTSDIVPSGIVPRQPPAPQPERVTSKPFNEAIWIPGYWAWVPEKQNFTWVCGIWRRPPSGHTWIAGYWMPIDDGWTWVRGFWSTTSIDQLKYTAEPPPNSLEENIPASPGENYFYVSGYWEYSPETKEYTWLQGAWQPFDSKWILSPAYYIWRPEGYVFVPPYWDYTIEERGIAYDCTDPIVVIEPIIVVRRCFAYYPDYLYSYWHWWHFHPGWWDNCWCLPPWWHWNDWWCFNWRNQWDLWWWYCHPDFPHPSWLSPQYMQRIPPPPDPLIRFFKKVNRPLFITPKGIPTTKDWIKAIDKHGKGKIKGPFLPLKPSLMDPIIKDADKNLPKVDKPLRPYGTELHPKDSKQIENVPKPKIPDEIKLPSGKVKVDKIPDIKLPEKSLQDLKKPETRTPIIPQKGQDFKPIKPSLDQEHKIQNQPKQFDQNQVIKIPEKPKQDLEQKIPDYHRPIVPIKPSFEQKKDFNQQINPTRSFEQKHDYNQQINPTRSFEQKHDYNIPVRPSFEQKYNPVIPSFEQKHDYNRPVVPTSPSPIFVPTSPSIDIKPSSPVFTPPSGGNPTRNYQPQIRDVSPVKSYPERVREEKKEK